VRRRKLRLLNKSAALDARLGAALRRDQAPVKLSRYIICSDAFEAPGSHTQLRVLYSTGAGWIRTVLEAQWQDLRAARFAVLDGRLLHALRDEGFIVDDGLDELEAVLSANKQAQQDYPVLYKVVQPTAACQLACDYCGQTHASKRIASSAIDALAADIDAALERGRYKALEIGWFGGEPLLAMKQITEASRSFRHIAEQRGVKYFARLVTSGVALSLDRFRTLRDECGVYFIEVTLDGPQAAHDARRAWKKTARASFDAIAANLDAIFALPEDIGKISLRCNVDARTADDVSERIDAIATRGWHRRLEKFYLAAVHPWGNDVGAVALAPDDFAAREIVWLAQMARLDFPLHLIPGRREIVCMTFKPEAELIDAYGEKYNCSEVSYVPVYASRRALKDVFPALVEYAREDGRNIFALTDEPSGGAPSAAEALTHFYDRVSAGEYPCAKCSLLPVCGGACPKSWLEGGHPCPPEKINMPQRLQLHHLLQTRRIGAAHLAPA
jgi:uncharacterized protein